MAPLAPVAVMTGDRPALRLEPAPSALHEEAPAGRGSLRVVTTVVPGVHALEACFDVLFAIATRLEGAARPTLLP